MSLRKSTCLTPQRLDANRRNARHSTGPRSEPGKERMRMNALQHGCEAAPENDAAVMRALGEDPERYAALKRDLATAYGPGDALWDRQLEDLGRLYWGRHRLERMQTGLMRRALEAVAERCRQLARALADVTFDPSQCDAVRLDLPRPGHPCVRLRMLISLWGVIRAQVRRRIFPSQQRQRVESYYQEQVGWRPRQIGYLLGLFAYWAYCQQQRDQAGLKKYVKDYFGDEAGVEARYQELERLLEEEIAALEVAFAEEMQAQEEKDAIARDACLAPEGKTWETLLRQEAALDRAIDRKVRIILAMRKEHARSLRAEASPPEEEEVRTCFSGPQLEQSLAGSCSEKAADLESGSALPLEAGTESQEEEIAPETSKSPEQSQNVIENKATAAEALCG